VKKLVILGSAGSIGENALRVVEALPSDFEVVGLATRSNVERLLAQASQFGVKRVALADPAAARACRAKVCGAIQVLDGAAGVEELAATDGVDIVLCAVVGVAGLKPVLAALRNGTDVALATKEVLVAAGALVMRTAAERGARILPVDSEHSAVLQCIADRESAAVKRVVLTGSGGPFGARRDVDWQQVTVSEAVAHPRWNMGRKISIDSATMMNKGLEIIEAHWLFDMPIGLIDVLIHPESIVHAMVEFVDGTVMAQLNPADMRFAIQYALTYPDRLDGNLPVLDLAGIGELTFEEPDEVRFPCLRLAREAGEAGGTMPAVLNAANEFAVAQFTAGALGFPGIWEVVETVLGRHRPLTDPALADILEADAWARAEAETIVGERAAGR
jgi:1-deoxy-D-xylulose-5-phosphate reductoisomerase